MHKHSAYCEIYIYIIQLRGILNLLPTPSRARYSVFAKRNLIELTLQNGVHAVVPRCHVLNAQMLVRAISRSRAATISSYASRLEDA